MPEPVLFLRREEGDQPFTRDYYDPLSAEEIDTIFRALEDAAGDDNWNTVLQKQKAADLVAKLREAENG